MRARWWLACLLAGCGPSPAGPVDGGDEPAAHQPEDPPPPPLPPNLDASWRWYDPPDPRLATRTNGIGVGMRAWDLDHPRPRVATLAITPDGQLRVALRPAPQGQDDAPPLWQRVLPGPVRGDPVVMIHGSEDERWIVVVYLTTQSYHLVHLDEQGNQRGSILPGCPGRICRDHEVALQLGTDPRHARAVYVYGRWDGHGFVHEMSPQGHGGVHHFPDLDRIGRSAARTEPLRHASE